MVRHTSYAGTVHENKNYDRNWAVSGYPSIHSRPPIN
jgi:hypothetical protein